MYCSALYKMELYRAPKQIIQPIMTQEEERYMAFMGLIQWAQAVVKQGERVRAANCRQMDIIQNLTSYDNNYTLLQETRLWFHIECHFFCIAANKFIEYRHWIKKFGLCKNVNFTEIDQFSKRDIKDLRNMSEHVIDYFHGEGHDKERWFLETPEFKVDASSVVNSLIGGRLDYLKFPLAVERLLPSLLSESIPYPSIK